MSTLLTRWKPTPELAFDFTPVHVADCRADHDERALVLTVAAPLRTNGAWQSRCLCFRLFVVVEAKDRRTGIRSTSDVRFASRTDSLYDCWMITASNGSAAVRDRLNGLALMLVCHISSAVRLNARANNKVEVAAGVPRALDYVCRVIISRVRALHAWCDKVERHSVLKFDIARPATLCATG